MCSPILFERPCFWLRFPFQERLPQSDIRNAYQKASLNGDGFGVGWYTNHVERSASATSLSLLRDQSDGQQNTVGTPNPDSECASSTSSKDASSQNDFGACVFTSLKPAWADRNLYNLAEKVRLGCKVRIVLDFYLCLLPCSISVQTSTSNNSYC